MSTYLEFIFLFIIAIIGGVLNKTISGAWFIVFPSLIYNGIQPVIGNSTTAMILWSEQIATSEINKRNHEISKKNIQFMVFISAIGGFIGAFLLATLSQEIFKKIAPYLLLFSWFLFAFYHQILIYINSLFEDKKNFKYSHWQLIPLFLLGIYGGYFGAALGMLIFALYSFYGVKNKTNLEALIILILLVNNGIAILVYVWSGLIYWPYATIMIVGCIIGGNLGKKFEPKINLTVVKKILSVIGAIVTLYFLNL